MLNKTKTFKIPSKIWKKNENIFKKKQAKFLKEVSILDKKYNPHLKDTALHTAVWANNFEAVEILLKNGANPTLKSSDGLTPHQQFRTNQFRHFKKDLRILNLLNDFKSGVINNNLTIKIEVDEIKKFSQFPQEKKDDYLFNAVENNRTYEIQHLLHIKANIHATDPVKKSPLHHAVCNRNFEATKFLLENGANPLLVDSQGRTPKFELDKWQGIRPDYRIITLLEDFELNWQQGPSRRLSQ